MSSDRLEFTRQSERRTSDEKLRAGLEFIATTALKKYSGWDYKIGTLNAWERSCLYFASCPDSVREDMAKSPHAQWHFSSWIEFFRTRPASLDVELARQREEIQRKEIYERAAMTGHSQRFGTHPWITKLETSNKQVEMLLVTGGSDDMDKETSKEKSEEEADPIADIEPVSLASVERIEPGDYYKHLFGLDAQVRILLSAVQAAADSNMENRFHSLLHGQPGCIAADTHIGYIVKSKEGRVQNSKGGTIENLFYRFNRILRPGKGNFLRRKTEESEFFVACVQDNNKIRINKILSVVDSGCKPVFLVLTKGNRYIKATKDHKFLKSDGSYYPLSELKPGDRVMVNPGIPQSKGGKKRVDSKEALVKQHRGGRKKIVNNCLYYRLTVQNAVIEADRNGMSYQSYIRFLNSCTEEEASKLWIVPGGSHVHHKDKNHFNNDLSNLEILVNGSEHTSKYHLDSSTVNIEMVAEEDTIVDIIYKGKEKTFDIMMQAPFHNFTANGFIVHNSGKTDILRSTYRLLSDLNISCLSIDATSTTEAGMRKYLLDEDEVMPEVILIEEIEKAVHSFKLLLGIMDDRGMVSQMNARRTASRKVPALILANANDYNVLVKMDSGALLSRFSNEIHCPRLDRETLARILEREVGKVKGGDIAWIEPTLKFGFDHMGVNDPRQLKRICLCGKERLLTGEYQRDLERTMKRAMGSGQVKAERLTTALGIGDV